ncbi:MAG: DEAD/DEAH box helicase [Chlamydiae bacterium]|nr:DEAD/DEAH box helicase [Chlamydiota bacterium]
MSFKDLGLNEILLKSIAEKGYESPTPVQSQCIPMIIQGHDLLAESQTGTGKTASFTLPMLHMLITRPLKVPVKKTRALVLAPTRELAAQIEDSVKSYGKYTDLKSAVVFGGVNVSTQIKRLKHGCDLLVATPGRLLDLLGQKAVDLSAVEFLVLDEADRMLDMGFIHDIKKVLSALPKQRQNLLFSATFSPEIKKLADGLLNSPKCVQVTKQNSVCETITHSIHLVDQPSKKKMLAYILKSQNLQQVLVFTRTKHGANKLCEQLCKDGISSAAIHGNKSQNARTKALSEFKSGAIRVLVATDIAARGIDIDQLPYVINYELPNVPEDYVHRIGRTGRAGHEGNAISLVSQEELEYLRDIEKLLKRKLNKVQLPGFEAKFSVTESDDTNGSKEIKVNPKRIFQRKKKPNPHKKVLHSAFQGHKQNKQY